MHKKIHHEIVEKEHSVHHHKKHIKHHISAAFWFLTGFILTGVLLTTLTLYIFQNSYQSKNYPGIFIDKEYVGEKTPSEVKQIFESKNNTLANTNFIFTFENQAATVSAKQLGLGYNASLLADQAFSLGRSKDPISNFGTILNAYFNGTTLHHSYSSNLSVLTSELKSIADKVHKDPVDALFTIQNNKVTAFRQSANGQTIDTDMLETTIKNQIPLLLQNQNPPKEITIAIPIKILKPLITTDKVNNLGIVELIAEGRSNFHHSIPNRIHNLSLAASRVNGILVKPNETFSFVQVLGDVSKFTGYKEAYVIENGRTVLGDGGGVCQVSTTLFRALLNAGLPIVERHPHAYRVEYYEENSEPGFDATIYPPSVDLKFKNDTGHYILIQNTVDLDNYSLSFQLYGTKDDRQVQLTKATITNQTPAPPPVYQDDPTSPKGTVKQVDFAAAGANVNFKRTVYKDGKVYLADSFTSNYRPWQAIFLKGTKE